MSETKEMTDLWAREQLVYAEGFTHVCGVDEAGRGPLAGPVYAAAVILPRDPAIQQQLAGLRDSKKLSEKRREALYEDILRYSESFGIGSASVEEIEAFNILEAAFLAMNRAIAQLNNRAIAQLNNRAIAQLNNRALDATLILVDGNRSKGLPEPARAVVKGDNTYACIAAASVLAKVSRDRYMREAAIKYPGYGFEKHKGYGTKAHYAAIRALGPCALHRPSFLRNLH